MKKLLALFIVAPLALVGCSSEPKSAFDYICTLPDGAQVHMTPEECNRAQTPGTPEWVQRQGELAMIEQQNAVTAGETVTSQWAERAAQSQQKHQEKCQDQLESRGYGDEGCY
jgi:hypothetical protein